MSSLNNVINAPYSTGTFTPGLAFGGASSGITYTVQSGYYTKIGNLIAIFIDIQLSSNGVSTGVATITGLPFQQSSSITHGIDMLLIDINNVTYPDGVFSLHATMVPSSTTMNINGTGPSVDSPQLTDTNFDTTSTFKVSGTYFTN